MVKRFGISVAIVMMVASTAEQSTAQIGIVGEQGSTRSLNSQAVSLTTLDGTPGFISATTQRPFVTSWIPVVGGYGGAYAPVYGPAPLLPQYRPGPSVIQRRIAQLRQQGYSPGSNRSQRGEFAAVAKDTAQSASDFTSRSWTAWACSSTASATPTGGWRAFNRTRKTQAKAQSSQRESSFAPLRELLLSQAALSGMFALPLPSANLGNAFDRPAGRTLARCGKSRGKIACGLSRVLRNGGKLAALRPV